MTSPDSLACSQIDAGAPPAPQALPASPALPWFKLLYRDYRRYVATEDPFFRAVFCSQGLWAIAFYRMSRALVLSIRPRFLRRFVRACISLTQKFVEIVTVGISLPLECEIGEGLYIGHHGTTILPAHGSLGKNCNLAHSITIGLAGVGSRRGAPQIGNRVFIGTQSVIAGKVQIGDDVMICAGTIVTRSIPPRAVVVGNPGRVVSYEGSFDYVQYDGMENDPERQASLALRGQPSTPDRTPEAK